MNKDKCSRCGYDKYKGSLHIHHKDGNHENNAPENLEVLCANCHMEYHHKNKIGTKRTIHESVRNGNDSDDCVGRVVNLEFDLDIYKKAHSADIKRITYLQNTLRSILSFREYKKIMDFYMGGWV